MNAEIQNKLNGYLQEKQNYIQKMVKSLQQNKTEDAMLWLRIESAINLKIEELFEEKK